MAVFLERVNSVPVQGLDFPFEFMQWLATLVDGLNTTIGQIDNFLISRDVVTAATQAAAINSTYIASNVAQTVITLPVSSEAVVGAQVNVRGLGAGGWQLVASAGQIINLGSTPTSVAGSLTSAGQYDTVDVTYIAANTWSVNAFVSSGLVVA